MIKDWNPQEEHIEGVLCEKGLLQERYDYESDDLVRTLTPLGEKKAKDLLKDPSMKKEYLKIANEFISKQPKEIQPILWKKIFINLK